MIPRILAATLVTLILLAQAPGLQADHLTLTVNPAAVTLPAGGVASVDVSVSGGGSEMICVEVGAPAGIDASLGFGPCGTGSFGGPLTVSAGPSAAPGSYSVTLSASVGTTQHASAVLTATVEAPATATPTVTATSTAEPSPSATPPSLEPPPAAPTQAPPPPSEQTQPPDPARIDFAAVDALDANPPFPVGLFLQLPAGYADCVGGEIVCQPDGHSLVLVPAGDAIVAWIEAPLSMPAPGSLSVNGGPFSGLELALIDPEASGRLTDVALVGSAPQSAIGSVFLVPVLSVTGELAVVPVTLAQSATGFSLTPAAAAASFELAHLPLVLVNGEVQSVGPSTDLTSAGQASSVDLDGLAPVVPVVAAPQQGSEGLALFAAIFEDGEQEEVVVQLISTTDDDGTPALPYLGHLEGEPVLYTALPEGLELAPGELLGGIAGEIPEAEEDGESVEVLASEDDGGGGYLGWMLGALGAAAVAGAAVFYLVNRRAPAVEASLAGVMLEQVDVPVGAGDDCDDVLRRWRELEAGAEAAEREAAAAHARLEQAEKEAEAKGNAAASSAEEQSSLEGQLEEVRAQVEQAEADVQRAADRMAEAMRDLEKAREEKGLAATYNRAALERRYRKLTEEGKAANERLQELIRRRDDLEAQQKEAAEEATGAEQQAESETAVLNEVCAEARAKVDAATTARNEANEYADRYRECIRGRIDGQREEATGAAGQATESARQASAAMSPAEAAAAAQTAKDAAERARAAAESLKDLKAEAEAAGLSAARAEAEREARGAAAQAGGAASSADSSARQKEKDDDARRRREEALEAQRLHDEKRREEAVARQIRNCEAKGPEARKRTARSPETLMRFTVPYGAEPGSFQHAIGEALNAIDRSKASLGPLADGLVALARGSTKDARDLWAIQKVTLTSFESTCCDGSGHERQVGEPVVTYRLRKLESMTDKQMDLIDGLPEELDDAIDLLDRIKGASVE